MATFVTYLIQVFRLLLDSRQHLQLAYEMAHGFRTHELWCKHILNHTGQQGMTICPRTSHLPLALLLAVQEGVGEEVQKSLGDTYLTFAGYQGTLNHFMEAGVSVCGGDGRAGMGKHHASSLRGNNRHAQKGK